MVASGPSAANTCLPPSSPVIVSVPPVPQATRGVRCTLDGHAGRLHVDQAVLVYASGKMVVGVHLDGSPLLPQVAPIACLVYRGHSYAVSAAKLAPSGCYVASGDERGCLRIWAFDHEEHLSKYECQGLLTSAIRDIAWDGESKRLAVGGERIDARSQCALAINMDGVTAGTLSQFNKGRVASVDFKPQRPMRVVTAGMDEPKLYFHKGPPFARVPPSEGVPTESSHTRGGVQCVRYSANGKLVASVGTDRSICLYDGTTLAFLSKLEQVHAATIYSVAWSADDQTLLTASGDGTCKLLALEGTTLKETHTWQCARKQAASDFTKVPVGGTMLGCTFVAGNRPVAVGYNGQLCLLQAGVDDMDVVTGHYSPIAGMAVHETAGVFYTGDTDGILCQWDLATTKCLKRLEPPEGNPDLLYIVHGTSDRPAAISGLAICGGQLLSVGWDDQMYTTKGDQVGLTPTSLGAQPSAIAAGTQTAVIVTVHGLLVVEGGKVGSMMSIPYVAQCVAVSKDDKKVYVGGDDCKIHIYSCNGSSLEETAVIDGTHLKPIHAVALSNDGTKLASGDEKDICVFDLANNNASIIGRGRWCFHLQKVTCLAWSKDDKILASGGADDAIYLWHLDKKMRRVHYPYAHRGGLVGLEFLQSSAKLDLLSVGADSVVNRWDVTKDAADKFK